MGRFVADWRAKRAAFTLATALGLWLVPLGSVGFGPWVLGLALLVGLPHGGLDHIISNRWKGWRGLWGQIRFHVAYLVSMIGIVVGWFVAPSAALMVFLAASAWHFGETDVMHLRGARGRRGVIVTRGALVVLAPMLARPQLTIEFLSSVTGANTAQVLGFLDGLGYPMAWGLLAAHLGALYATLGASEDSKRAALDAVALAALMILGGPLLGIPLYFILWHTPDHFIAAHTGTSLSTRSVGAVITALLPRTVGGVALIGGLLWWLDASLWPLATVWTISALTLPHAFVVHYGLGEDGHEKPWTPRRALAPAYVSPHTTYRD